MMKIYINEKGKLAILTNYKNKNNIFYFLYINVAIFHIFLSHAHL